MFHCWSLVLSAGMVFFSHCIEETMEALSGVAPGVLDDSMVEVEAG